MSPNVEEPAARAHRLLDASGATVATAESLTGGRLAAALTADPGASRTYVGGVVAYATSVKVAVLGVPQSLVDGPGVVSAECARAMADGVRGLTGATYALSTTGVAGPDSQDGRPPGTVYVGLAGPGHSVAIVLELSGDRAAIQERTAREALSALCDRLRSMAREPEDDSALG